MQATEMTEEQARALLERLLARLPDPVIEHYRETVRWTQGQIMTGLFAAGFCACAGVWVIVAAIPEDIRRSALSVFEFGISIPWYVWLLLFAAAGSFCFFGGCSWFAEHEESMRAGERAHLLLMLDELAKAGVELSTREAISLIASVPYSLPWGQRHTQ